MTRQITREKQKQFDKNYQLFNEPQIGRSNQMHSKSRDKATFKDNATFKGNNNNLIGKDLSPSQQLKEIKYKPVS